MIKIFSKIWSQLKAPVTIFLNFDWILVNILVNTTLFKILQNIHREIGHLKTSLEIEREREKQVRDQHCQSVDESVGHSLNNSGLRLFEGDELEGSILFKDSSRLLYLEV